MSENARYQRFNLRVPRDLLDRLEAASAENSHSTNAEIVRRLELSFKAVPITSNDTVIEAVVDHVSRSTQLLYKQNRDMWSVASKILSFLSNSPQTISPEILSVLKKLDQISSPARHRELLSHMEPQFSVAKSAAVPPLVERSSRKNPSEEASAEPEVFKPEKRSRHLQLEHNNERKR